MTLGWTYIHIYVHIQNTRIHIPMRKISKKPTGMHGKNLENLVNYQNSPSFCQFVLHVHHRMNMMCSYPLRVYRSKMSILQCFRSSLCFLKIINLTPKAMEQKIVVKGSSHCKSTSNGSVGEAG